MRLMDLFRKHVRRTDPAIVEQRERHDVTIARAKRVVAHVDDRLSRELRDMDREIRRP